MGFDYFCKTEFVATTEIVVMAKSIKIRKGLSLNLKGKAPLEHLSAPKPSSTYGLVPDDYVGVTPKLLVHVGDKVECGTPLFYDKTFPEIKFTSPVAGEVVAVNRGAKRKILSVEVRPSGETASVSFAPYKKENTSREALLEMLLSSGMWALFKQRPYDRIANPEEMPRDIFVTANLTAPLAPSMEYLLKGREEDLQVALSALQTLTNGSVYLGVPANFAFTAPQGVEVVSVEGPHPAGNVGVLINHIRPLNKGEVVWTLKATDLLVVGRFLRTGKVDFSRTIAIAGSDAAQRGYVTITPGARVLDLYGSDLCVKKEHERIINGDVLTGVRISDERPFASLNIDLISIIPEGDDYDEAFGWIAPRFKQFSANRSYFSWLLGKKREYAFDARIKGGERAMIMSHEYDRVFPMDIFPEQLIKATIAYDIDKMEALGIYEVAPEDFALCEFVCSSKMELQYIIRNGLDLLYKEMN